MSSYLPNPGKPLDSSLHQRHGYALREAATNLAPPAIWTPISTNVAGSNGQWQFTDPQAANFFQRFYRTEASY